MVLYNKRNEVIAVYPYGSEEQQRYERVLEILFEADRRSLEKLIEERRNKEQAVDSQIEEGDKTVFRKCNKKSAKRYNMTQTARILGVHGRHYIIGLKKAGLNQNETIGIIRFLQF